MVRSHRLGIEAGALEAQPPNITLVVPGEEEQGSDPLTPVARAWAARTPR